MDQTKEAIEHKKPVPEKAKLKTVLPSPGETNEELARRTYCLSDRNGNEDPKRMKRVLAAIQAANGNFESKRKVKLPEVEHVPYLRAIVKDKRSLNEAAKGVLSEAEGNQRRLALFSIDPLRLGSEELGISWAPEMATHIHSALKEFFSFNQRRYLQIRDHRNALTQKPNIQWHIRIEEGGEDNAVP